MGKLMSRAELQVRSGFIDKPAAAFRTAGGIRAAGASGVVAALKQDIGDSVCDSPRQHRDISGY